jgi:hypothetical protein
MSVVRRHKRDSKNFEEETYSEQSKSISIKILWLLSATRNHIRKCAREKGNREATKVPAKVASQLRRMADRIEVLPTPRGTTVPISIEE